MTLIYRFYSYYPNEINQLLARIVDYAAQQKIYDFSCKKSYMKGFHLAVKTSKKSAINDFLKKVTLSQADTDINYKRVQQQIEIISRFEESELINFPLERQGEIKITNKETFLYPAKQIFPLSFVKRIEEYETKLLINSFNEWKNFNVEEQNEAIAKLFLLFAKRNRFGIKYGYLAFKSNSEYFHEQLKDLSEKNQEKLENYLNQYSNTELALKDNFASFLKLKNYSGTLQHFEIFLDEINDLVNEVVVHHDIDFTKMYHADDFFERHLHWSEFHGAFYSNQVLVNLYHQPEFLSYRLSIGILYSILPELGISNLRKEKITCLVSMIVEDYFQSDWKQLLNVGLSK